MKNAFANSSAMKKLLLAYTFLSIALLSFSQGDTKKKLSIGVMVGFSTSAMRGTEVGLYESGGATVHSKQGVVFGLIARKDIAKHIVGSAGLNIITKGGTYKNSPFYESSDKKATYLQMPVLIGYNHSPQAKMEVRPEIGFALNYSIAPYDYNPDNYLNSASIKTPRFMLSPIAGMTVMIKGKSTDFFIAARYEFDNSKYFDRQYLQWNYYLKHSGSFVASAGILL